MEPKQVIRVIRRTGFDGEFSAAVNVDDVLCDCAAFAERGVGGGVFDERRFAGEVAWDGFEGFGGEHRGAFVED